MKNENENNIKTKIEVYLQWLICSYLNGDFEKSKKYLETLRKINNIYPQSFLFLTSLEVKRMKNIAYALDNNIGLKTYSINPVEGEEISNSVNMVKQEKELVNRLIKNEELLKETLGIKTLKIMSVEKKTEYGNVDIFAKSKRFAIPIEAKKGKASFEIVSQIDKYMKHFLKMLHYKLWEDVIGVTIANSYDKYALEELKRLGVRVLTYDVTENLLNLRRVG